MYGDVNIFHDENNILRNEITFTNLIAIANNQTLFNSLDHMTQQELVKIIGAYTRGCIDSILKSYNDDAKFIRSHIK